MTVFGIVLMVLSICVIVLTCCSDCSDNTCCGVATLMGLPFVAGLLLVLGV